MHANEAGGSTQNDKQQSSPTPGRRQGSSTSTVDAASSVMQRCLHARQSPHTRMRTADSPQRPGRSASRRPSPYARPVLATIIGGLLAGCQTLGHRTAEPDGDTHGHWSEVALGDPELIEPLSLEPVARLPAPVIELDPIPEPAQENIIERLRAEFSLPDADDDALRRELEYFARHSDYLGRVLNRAAPYLHYIAEELEARGMPLDLALLPIVESAFDPFAYSRGRASGLWQIIPGTARRLNVKQNWWFDGRRDVIESTRGALDYLEMLHGMFDGDWLLAVAGYNSGEGNVARALRRAAAADRTQDFWGIRSYLPRETRTYVPRLLAIRNLVANAEEYGIDLPAIPNRPYFAVIDIGAQIELALAAELAGVSAEELQRLNAGFNRWATDPDGPHRLLVPIESAERFETALASLDQRERVQWSRHRIQTGDTLSQIAARYGTTAAVLREINGINGHMIRAGDYLMIPRTRGAYERYAGLQAAQGGQESGWTGEQLVHVVRRGESLWSIAQRYGVQVAALARWNGMTPNDTLPAGRELVVRVGEGAMAVQARASASAGALGPDQTRRVDYVVRRGDSLSSIAQRFRVTVAQLLQWNRGVSASRYLQPGDRLVMYVNVIEQST